MTESGWISPCKFGGKSLKAEFLYPPFFTKKGGAFFKEKKAWQRNLGMWRAVKNRETISFGTKPVSSASARSSEFIQQIVSLFSFLFKERKARKAAKRAAFD